MNKKLIYKDLLELADIHLQEQVWLGKRDDYVSSYDELMCSLFDDNRFDDFVEKEIQQTNMNSQEIGDFLLLQKLLNEYNSDEKVDKEIIADPAWRKITRHAEKCLVHFSKMA